MLNAPTRYSDTDGFDPIEAEKLFQLAKNARASAHAPYSGFRVGAALLTKDGMVFCGVNVENASYPLTNCAERSAIFSAVSQGYTEFTAIAICGGKDDDDTDSPCYPCGACRQVMTEFCDADFPIILSDKILRLGALLPYSFSL